MPPENTNLVGILLLIFEADFTRLVLRAVLADHQLELEVRLLHHHAFNRLADVGLVVVGDHLHRNNRVLAQLLGIARLDTGDVHRVAGEDLNRLAAQDFKLFF